MYLRTSLALWLFCHALNTHARSTYTSVPPLQSLTQSSSSASPSNPTTSASNPTCTQPLTAANTEVAPILPGNRLVPAPYRLPDSFIYPHILFIYTDFNIQIPRAAWATFCLDQCIAYSGNKTCYSFEVDQGVPFPPLPEGQNQAKRWWCEGFDEPLRAELFVPNTANGSYERVLGVNRVCGGKIRDY